MNKLALLLPLALLAACGEEPAAQTAPEQVVTPEPIETLPAPDQALLTEKYAEACPDEEPINTAMCKRAGMGSPDVVCEFGLGDDEYLRNKATLTAGEGEWTFADPENVCVG
ncbi:MAG TPA: hypothetical protein DCX71_09000 [Erythrobacter sp.]|uniref:Lipoprotein n=2 Tax=Qipengyuania citrea TaxID=225971 RepID=A0A6I4UDG0_9SPHN|nr:MULTISPECIES: hypothetical protein [Erythrobacteraceae]MAC30079.1 hypothetical protein [Erythrobacter sp.]MAL54992.1 hypothetical protein [Sphingomonadaceae bacterium]MBK62232.1 hypothetical protein [Altererythrobacter sp.]MBN92207.1 hypothetical protein [Erythrobacteraceae bacterium]MCZ4265113.1 hypothetical protein [Erythrobacter sp. G21629-S1]